MISSRKIEEGESQIISRMLEVKKILDKSVKERMPFETIELCHFLSKVTFFKQLSLTETEQFISVASNASIIEMNAGQCFFKEGDVSSHMYLILKGSVKMTLNSIVSNVSRCSTFGQLEIMFNYDQRISNAVTLTDSWCIIFDRQLVFKLCEQRYRVSEIYGFIERNPYFNTLNQSQKLYLSTKSQKIKYDEGSYILQVGEIPDKILCVLGGTVSVLKYVTKGQRVFTYDIDILEQGAIVGQHESLNKIKSQIALYCRSRVACFLINLSEIQKHTDHLTRFFQKSSTVYPAANQILDLLQEQESNEQFKKKEKKYLVRRKEKMR